MAPGGASAGGAGLAGRRQARALALFFLVLTAVLSLAWSDNRLMWNDEFLSFYSDSVATVAGVVEVQLHHPISLDPPAYHVLSHLSMDLVGRNAMALRLPALAGFLLLELSLYGLVRRLAGGRAAVVAMALPLVTASFRYSVEGRPYGLLLGLYAAALLCWQRAAEREGSPRVPALAGLAAAIGLAILSHYFGVLILIPVTCGEAARTMERRRLDWGVVGALAAGMAAVLLVLPFQRALMVYRQHYYITGVNWHDVTQGYRELFLRYTTWPIPEQKAAAALLALGTVVLAVAGYRRYKQRPEGEPAYVWVALTATALLPVFGYLFGRFVTHTMEVRYVIATLIAFAAVLAMVLERRLQRDGFYYGLLAAIVAAALAIQGSAIAAERRDTRTMLASFELTPEVAAALRSDPSRRIYTQSLNDFFLNTYYAPQADLRPRFSLLYGQDEEIRWLAHDTNFVTATNMAHFTPLSVTPYAEFLRESKPWIVLYHSGWEWIDTDVADKHLAVVFAGTCMRGELMQVDTGGGLGGKQKL